MHPIDAPTQKEAPPIPATRTTLRTAERTASELQTNRMAVLQAVAVEWNGPRKEVAQALTAMRILRQVVAAANPIAAAVVARTAAMKVAQVMTAVRILRCGVRMATLPEEEEAAVSTNGSGNGGSRIAGGDERRRLDHFQEHIDGGGCRVFSRGGTCGRGRSCRAGQSRRA